MKKTADTTSLEVTFFDALVVALNRAGSYNKNDQTPPVVVLWPDKERQWEPLLPRLRARLPILTLGEYAPEQRMGPAYWLRAMIARALPDDQLPADVTPILYLPGVSKHEIRAVEESPRALQPLAELQYRGALWTQKNGRDWTLTAFLQSADGGLGIEVSGDNATREALQRALPKLADESLMRLRKEAPLRAAFFDELLNPDEVRSVLQWLDDPTGYRERRNAAEWAAFCGLCQRKYGFHPEKDGPISAARRLGERQEGWELVWRRFTESPESYPHIPGLLRQARPQQPLSLFDYAESWPQENDAAERALREGLATLREQVAQEARAAVRELESIHGSRREWVWRRLGEAPLAVALERLAALASATERAITGDTADEVAASYMDWGWRADDAALAALAEVEQAEDVAAVKGAVRALYRPWLETAALALQRVASQSESQNGGAGYPDRSPTLAPQEGTCILFCDALRFDAGRRLADALAARGLSIAIMPQFAALPTVTPTAKPAISPVREQLTGGAGFDTVARETGARVTVEVLRRLLIDNGYQILKGDEMGDPSGRAWTELGAIDAYGHEHGWKLAHHIAGELRALEWRIAALLDAGWRRVVVVTDHGWLLLPDGLPKVELAEHLATIRKGRCARLKDASSVDQLTLPWRWDAHVRMAYASGIACYEAGKEYAHGGISPQECVTPLITVTRETVSAAEPVAIEQVTWRGLRCSMRISGATTEMRVDLRTKPGDAATSLVGTPKAVGADGAVTLLVADDDRLGEAAAIVVVGANGADGALQAQMFTTVGG